MAMHISFPTLARRAAEIVVALGLMLPAAAFADEGRLLRSPDGGEVRALILGIDDYRHVRQLKGAVADAQDIEGALRRTGVGDVTSLIDAKADRASVLSTINRLIARSGPRDLVIISLAGHGAQEPERVRGSQPDGVENVFLLAGFDTTGAGSQERILGAEFNHFIKQFEARGAHVLFIADTCFGGGMTRDIDPRSEQMSFRQVPSYRLSADLLQPVTTTADELTTEADFDRTVFLAAVDRRTKAPEVQIPGIAGLRGALSYAVARAIEGDPNTRSDGTTTLRDFFGNIRQVVYQLSNQRQNIVTTASPRLDPGTDVVFRSVTVREPAANPGSGAEVAEARNDRPIKIAALDGNRGHFDGLARRESAFDVVAPSEHPDLIWDTSSGEVLAWGDVVTSGVDSRDLPIVIDRAAAIRELKRMATKEPQPIRIAPDDDTHHKAEVVSVQMTDVGQRALILVNIAGDGTVQMLYPDGKDDRIIPTAQFEYKVRVQEPFGSDQLIAVTSRQPMTALEQALHGVNRRPMQVIDLINRLKPADARIGSAGLFTAK
jgi:Caspase domain